MALSWNEIKKRAIEFQREWTGVTKENAETQSFYNDFFDVFGMSRRRVAVFEAPVKKLGDKRGRIDLFWKGILLVEQKSKGRDLEEAHGQALDYFPNLKDNELPRYVLVSDFNDFDLYDLDNDEKHSFQLKDFHKYIHLFGFIAGYKRKEYKDTEPVNIKAAELMGDLYDSLKEARYAEHDLELFLVRILFCLFADDTGIFEKGLFTFFMEEKTKEDGSDVGSQLATLFQVLNTPIDKRQKTLDEDITRFPYINGLLFDKQITIPAFDSKMREALLKCCYFDWEMISPAVFGSLFQSVDNKEKRRNLGAHYTTEKNIMKVIEPLFLDDLKKKFKQIKGERKRLIEFYNELSMLTFLDPACGCGNFLILAYREIRRLEIEVLKELHKKSIEMNQQELDVSNLSKIDVDHFYGIEIEEFPAKIAEVALWLMDHLMNVELSEAFGLYYIRIPLKKAANIINNNALRLDWKQIISPKNLNYIFGNPPFLGHHYQSKEQKEDLNAVLCNIQQAGVMDYVSAWYIKSAEFIYNTKIKVAFVSTSSISQGEQVGILWNELFNSYGVKIHFAHRTFAWNNEARGVAHVHVIIIGFGCFDVDRKKLFDYSDGNNEPHETQVKNITPYLTEGRDIIITNRSVPVCNVPQMMYGSKPTDGGFLLFTDEEKIKFIDEEPKADKFIKPLLSAKEFLNGQKRWCLWLVDADPKELQSLPKVIERIESVRLFRQKSTAASTQGYKYHSLFRQLAQPKEDYILVPLHSSENRKYIPLGFFSTNYIANNSCSIIPGASLYHFGVLTSEMHMVWMRYTCGRLESRYRYSKDIVYNNFPWPENPGEAKIKKVEEKATAVLEARKVFPGSSLADLYDPDTMPQQLVKAHLELDKTVDACYGKTSFQNDRARIEFLFDLYEKYIMRVE